MAGSTRLSYQVYFSADMVCYEGRGVPVDIKLFNKKAILKMVSIP